MQTPLRHLTSLGLMKKSSRYYDFRAEIDLDQIRDDSTGKGDSDSISPFKLDDSFESGSIQSDI